MDLKAKRLSNAFRVVKLVCEDGDRRGDLDPFLLGYAVNCLRRELPRGWRLESVEAATGVVSVMGIPSPVPLDAKESRELARELDEIEREHEEACERERAREVDEETRKVDHAPYEHPPDDIW